MTRLDLKRLLSILPQRDGDRRDDALMANQLWNDNSWQTNHIGNCIRNIEWTLETITDKYIGLWPNRGGYECFNGRKYTLYSMPAMERLEHIVQLNCHWTPLSMVVGEP